MSNPLWMRGFRPLLRELIDQRFDSDRDFADAVEVGSPYLSQVLNGHKPPPLKTIDKWADVLALQGEDRKTFIFAAELATSPAAIHERLDELEAVIADQEREISTLRAKLIRLLDPTDRPAAAPRQPTR